MYGEETLSEIDALILCEKASLFWFLFRNNFGSSYIKMQTQI